MSAHKSVSEESCLKKDASRICFRIPMRTADVLSLRLNCTQFLSKLTFVGGKVLTVEISMLEKDNTIEELSLFVLDGTLVVAVAANADSCRITFKVKVLAIVVALIGVRLL